MCPPTPLFAGPVSGPTHRSAPTDSIATFINPGKPGGDRAPPLQGPKAMNTQRRFEIYQAIPNLVSRKPKTPGITAGTPPPSTVPRKTRSPSTPPSGFPKGASAPFGRFKGVPGENTKSPRESFLGSARGYSFDLKRISSRKPPTKVGGSPARQSGNLRRHAGSSCPTGCPHRGRPTRRLIEVNAPGCHPAKPPGFPGTPPTGRLASAAPKKRAARRRLSSLFPQTLFRS